jgi:aminocarboxymuconate-semialdehyde decarboxylase
VTDRVIDTHAHYFPKPYLELLATDRGKKFGFGYHPQPGGSFLIETPGGMRGPQPGKYYNLELRLADMDAQGVKMQGLSLTAPMVYFADGEYSLDLCKAYNDATSASAQQYPDRLYGYMTLPMLDTDRALKELARASKLPGLKGVYMGTHMEGHDLSDSLFEPVYEAIASLKLPIFLHPVKPLGGPRLKPFHLGNLIGNPTETATAAAHLIFGGVLDRHPTLEVSLPHAGGSLPELIGRFDHGYKVRKEMKHMPRKPSEYLRRFTYDTITHSPDILKNLAALVGTDRILLGSDYCADMGSTDPVRVVDEAGFKGQDRARILTDNAVKLLNL